MELHLDLSGTPAEVRAALDQALASARREAPLTAAIGGALSDAASASLAGLGPNARVAIKADIVIVTVERLDGKEQPVGEDGLIHGDEARFDSSAPLLER